MYISDIGVDELSIIGIMEPYLMVLGSAIIIFICLYLYMYYKEEQNQSNSNIEEEEETSDSKPPYNYSIEYQSIPI